MQQLPGPLLYSCKLWLSLLRALTLLQYLDAASGQCEVMRHVHGCREVYFLLAALCLLVGATTTHGLGGSLRHKQTGPFTMELGSDVDPRQPDPVTTWRFYQPFRCTPAAFEPSTLPCV